MRAIETKYKGYRFRSRLEARWAVFFDALKFLWAYEPQGYRLSDGTSYLPDFWLPYGPGDRGPGGDGEWVEIKGQTPTANELNMAGLLAHGSKCPVYVLTGDPMEHRRYDVSAGSSIGRAYDVNIYDPRHADWWANRAPFVREPAEEAFSAQVVKPFDLAKLTRAKAGPAVCTWDLASFRPSRRLLSQRDVQEAAEKARSARFEHGEAG